MRTCVIVEGGDVLVIIVTLRRNEAWEIIQLGLGGYVIERSVEKTANAQKDTN